MCTSIVAGLIKEEKKINKVRFERCSAESNVADPVQSCQRQLKCRNCCMSEQANDGHTPLVEAQG